MVCQGTAVRERLSNEAMNHLSASIEHLSSITAEIERRLDGFLLSPKDIEEMPKLKGTEMPQFFNDLTLKLQELNCRINSLDELMKRIIL